MRSALVSAHPPGDVPYTDFNGVSLGLFPAPSFEGDTPDQHSSAALRITPFELNDSPGPGTVPDLGIHLHLHFPDQLQEMTHWLGQVPFPFHLYVSITDPAGVAQARTHLQKRLHLATVDARLVENRGRDLAPLVTEFARDLAGHEFIGHLHTKRSAHSVVKSDWRRQLLANLMGSPATVQTVFEWFAADPALGMVFPVYHHSLRKQISWGNNFSACEQLAAQLNLSIQPGRLVLFPAGSMFWARSKALEKLLAAGLTTDTFPEETGQLDGTPAHALERLFGTLVVDQGASVLQICAERPYGHRCFDPPVRSRLRRWLQRS